MLEQLNDFIREHSLLKGRKPVLAAVSGGIDSVVMIHLLRAAGIPLAVAHCNFGLRGRESDGDERFVKKLAAQWNVPFHSKKFETKTFAADNGLGIQAAARKLRYDWFSELIKEFGYQSTATAHHAGDVAETIVLHLVRGSALAGYHGIRPRNQKIIRPLLFATRDEIEAYAQAHGLKWREDSSNETDHYTRNRIRHHIIPLLKEINPSLENTLLRNAAIMDGYEALVRNYTDELRKLRVKQSGNNLSIDIRDWMEESVGAVLLYEWLKEYGFTGDACRKLSRAIIARSTGKTFPGHGYSASLGRTGIIIAPETTKVALPEISLVAGGKMVNTPFFNVRAERVSLKPGNPLTGLPGFTSPEVAWLDADKLKGELKLCPWKRGDRFRPLGMKGTRLVSDFITDLHFTREQKEKLYLLKVGTEIVWVAGYRIDDRFKLTTKTTTAIKVSLYSI